MSEFVRCLGCGIALTDRDEILWCKMQQCPHTKQRLPTEEQRRQFKIGEDNENPVSRRR